MYKLLRNYIREQKSNLLQVFGLGFLVIIMIVTFLALNFSTSYVTDQYVNQVANKQFHQMVTFNEDQNAFPGIGTFRQSPFDMDGCWLDNLDYYAPDSNGAIIGDRLANATFQLNRIDATNNIYRFIFGHNGDDDIKNDPDIADIAAGDAFAQLTNHNYIDFQVSAPQDYTDANPSYLPNLINTINQYVYKSTGSIFNANNKVNWFITGSDALNYYNTYIKPKNPYAQPYTSADIDNENQLYQALISGMLYGRNLEWKRDIIVRDLFMTGKILAFIQVNPTGVINQPVLVADGGISLQQQPLQDGELLIYREFAKQNNLKLGDDYNFAGHTYKIRGFATSSIAASRGFYFDGVVDNKNQTVAFATKNTVDQIVDSPYSKVKFNNLLGYNPEHPNFGTSNLNNKWMYQFLHQRYQTRYHNDEFTNTTGIDYLANNNGIDAAFVFNPLNMWNSSGIIEWDSVANLNGLKTAFNQISSVFLILIFIVTVVIIFIIIFKMIDRNKRFIGILKANGYHSWKLNIALILAIITPLIGFAIVGTVIAALVSKFIISAFNNMFCLVSINFAFYWLPATLVIVLPVLALFIIAFLIVAYLLKTPALTLISNNWSSNKYNASIGWLFSFISLKVIKKFSYKNKLVITNTLRNIGKMSLVMIISVFGSTLLLFSFASAGLINNMLGLQFAAINYNYGSEYLYNNNDAVQTNFINSSNQLLYHQETTKTIKSRPSLFLAIKQVIQDYIDNKTPSSTVVDFRDGYIMGSELLQLRQLIEANRTILDQNWPGFEAFWTANQYYIDYLTNNNGKNSNDLMLSFGLLPYDQEFESPYLTINFSEQQTHDFSFDIIQNDHITYNNTTNMLEGDWTKYYGIPRVLLSVNDNSSAYLTPGLKNSNMADFANLSIANMSNSSFWLNQNFINIRNKLITQLGISDPDNAAVQIIPMIGSTDPGLQFSYSGGYGNRLGKMSIYQYQSSFDNQTKYLIGVTYDGAKNLRANQILMPEKWLKQALGGHNVSLLTNFANAKFSDLSSGELQNYLPIISTTNDYKFDIAQFINDQNAYLKTKGILPALSLFYDVNAVKALAVAQEYSFQSLLLFFAIFSVILTFMIIIIISNLNLRDNLLLINILKSLGYSNWEVSYIFLIIALPLLIICALVSVYIAPILTGILANTLSNILHVSFPVIFQWWYFALTFFLVLVIYVISYLITWKLNINRGQLTKLTE